MNTEPGRMLPNDIRGAFGVGAETLLRAFRTFIEMRGEVNDSVVVRTLLSSFFVENVEIRTTGKIVGGEKLANVRAQIAAASGYQESSSSHASTLFHCDACPLASAFSCATTLLCRWRSACLHFQFSFRRSGLKMIFSSVAANTHDNDIQFGSNDAFR